MSPLNAQLLPAGLDRGAYQNFARTIKRTAMTVVAYDLHQKGELQPEGGDMLTDAQIDHLADLAGVHRPGSADTYDAVRRAVANFGEPVTDSLDPQAVVYALQAAGASQLPLLDTTIAGSPILWAPFPLAR
ncbi:hypothetical protein [Streptomyces mirabilis]|uniref:hypothetical protein n=1 Tax=Streptomyces mirabilis TaxID=68239 RepID=UPI0033D0F598